MLLYREMKGENGTGKREQVIKRSVFCKQRADDKKISSISGARQTNPPCTG